MIKADINSYQICKALFLILGAYITRTDNQLNQEAANRMEGSIKSSFSDYSYSYASSHWLFENMSRPSCPEDSGFLVLYHYPDEWIELLLYTQADKFMITIVFPFIVTLGVLANSAFLFTIVRVPKMRKLTNFYLANLAFADLFFVVVTTVNYFYKYIWSPDFERGSPWARSFGCAAMAAASYIPYFASISLVTLVSIERYLAISYPLKYRMANTKSRAVKLVISAWIIAIAFTAAVAPNYAVLRFVLYGLKSGKIAYHLL